MPATKRNYHHGDLHSALLEAALTVLDELGPQGLTIREVARRAGVSHAAPYRHFADKDALILAVVEQGFALMQDTMDARREAAPADPVHQFAASGLAYVDFALQHPAHYRVMFSGDLLSSKGGQSLQHTSREALQQMVADIQNCQTLGIVREGDAITQALTILSTLHGFVSLVIDNRVDHLLANPASLESMRNEVLGQLFAGLAAPQVATNNWVAELGKRSQQ